MSDRTFTIVCSLISLALSTIITAISHKIIETRTSNIEKYKSFYYPFSTLVDHIHQGRAYNFTDLSNENQEKIIHFLIDNGPYVNSDLKSDVYILKCSHHDNYEDFKQYNMDCANQAYNNIVNYMQNKETKLRKRYISKI
jgi:hypothetical protein